jgi:hypothetical protein
MNIGLKECSELFNNHRYNTKCKGITLNEFLIKKDLPGYCQRYLDKYIDDEEHRIKLYSMYFGSCSNFRPINAINIYKLYNTKNVLDPCAGWGGRCYGAMVCNVNYIGFDTNINLKEAYDELIKRYNTTNDIQIKFEDSSKVDYSKYTYDTVLTSPPYYKRELYENMPVYKTKKMFNKNFYIPMIRNSYKYLSPGGYYCLNVSEKMYKLCCDIFERECDDKIPLIKSSRKKQYNEYIYVWKKN